MYVHTLCSLDKVPGILCPLSPAFSSISCQKKIKKRQIGVTYLAAYMHACMHARHFSCIRVELWLWAIHSLNKETIVPTNLNEQPAHVPWSQAFVWSRGKHGSCEKTIPAWSWANMGLHLITGKLQLDHQQARSCIWSRANISSMITRKHGVAFDHEQTSPAWPRASTELRLITSKCIYYGGPQ